MSFPIFNFSLHLGTRLKYSYAYGRLKTWWTMTEQKQDKTWNAVTMHQNMIYYRLNKIVRVWEREGGRMSRRESQEGVRLRAHPHVRSVHNVFLRVILNVAETQWHDNYTKITHTHTHAHTEYVCERERELWYPPPLLTSSFHSKPTLHGTQTKRKKKKRITIIKVFKFISCIF